MVSDYNCDCAEYRENFDEFRGNLLNEDIKARLDAHERACPFCQQWRAQMNDMLVYTTGLPQFDVPEQLTQSILSALSTEPKKLSAIYSGAIISMAAVCFMGSFTILPVDTTEGLLSTAIGLAGIFLIKLLISHARTEELVI